MSIESVAPNYEAELLLLFSCLNRAMLDALGNFRVNCKDDEQLMIEARDWLGLFRLNQENYTPEPWSSDWVCAHLNLDLPRLRDLLEDAILSDYCPRQQLLSDDCIGLILQRANLNRVRGSKSLI